MFELIAQSSGGTSQTNPIVSLLPILLIGVVFYFLAIRPQQRKMRAQRELLSSIEVGDDVLTVAGIMGTIIEIDEDEDLVTVEIAPGTRVRMVRRAISQRVGADEDAYEDGTDYEDDGADADPSR
jgi:preprotein translocase subunit YajC